MTVGILGNTSQNHAFQGCKCLIGQKCQSCQAILLEPWPRWEEIADSLCPGVAVSADQTTPVARQIFSVQLSHSASMTGQRKNAPHCNLKKHKFESVRVCRNEFERLFEGNLDEATCSLAKGAEQQCLPMWCRILSLLHHWEDPSHVLERVVGHKAFPDCESLHCFSAKVTFTIKDFQKHWLRTLGLPEKQWLSWVPASPRPNQQLELHPCPTYPRVKFRSNEQITKR